MAFTNFSTSILNYGPSLPTGQIPDGSMFNLTTGATGLYLYSFMQDTMPGTPGEQVGSGWKLIASTGPLDADKLDGYHATDFQFVDGDLTAISNMTGVGFAVRTGVDTWATRSFIAGTGITLSNTTGSADITISANLSGVGLNTLSGVLDIAHGGTNGANVPTAGAVAYGTGSAIAYTSAGSAGQVLVSGGATTPTWTAGSVTIGSTNVQLGGTVTNIAGLTQVTSNSFVGPLTGKADTAGVADSANAVTWANVSGKPTTVATSGLTDAVSSSSLTTALALYSTTGHNHSLNTLSNVAIAAAQTNDLLQWNGTNWVNSSTAAKASTLAQGGGTGAAMTFNYSGQIGQPSYVWGTADGITTNVWNPSSFNVAKASTLAQGGGTGAAMTFNYAGLGGTPTYVWGTADGITTNVYSPSSFTVANTTSISSAVGSSYVWTASQTFNADLTITGSVTAAGGGGGLARAILVPGTGGGASTTGAIDFYSVVGREGYIGRSTSVQTADGGTIPYVTGTHAFTGNISTSANVASGHVGTITAAGDVIAYSDARLKMNVQTIVDPIGTVNALRGVTFERIDSGKKSLGVIAQEVQAVLPELVSESADGTLGVAYGNMVGVLIEAIKEQQKQIDALREQVKQLVSSSSL